MRVSFNLLRSGDCWGLDNPVVWVECFVREEIEDYEPHHKTYNKSCCLWHLTLLHKYSALVTRNTNGGIQNPSNRPELGVADVVSDSINVNVLGALNKDGDG